MLQRSLQSYNRPQARDKKLVWALFGELVLEAEGIQEQLERAKWGLCCSPMVAWFQSVRFRCSPQVVPPEFQRLLSLLGMVRERHKTTSADTPGCDVSVCDPIVISSHCLSTTDL